tara:strand:- start:559 stop:696 length:138 start_codon:yes stop_codon:yes gene_type:complete
MPMHWNRSSLYWRKDAQASWRKSNFEKTKSGIENRNFKIKADTNE